MGFCMPLYQLIVKNKEPVEGHIIINKLQFHLLVYCQMQLSIKPDLLYCYHYYFGYSQAICLQWKLIWDATRNWPLQYEYHLKVLWPIYSYVSFKKVLTTSDLDIYSLLERWDLWKNGRENLHDYHNTDTQGDIILSDTPDSRNVSGGTLVNFTCATPETGLTVFAISANVTLGNTTNNDVILPNGHRQVTLSFVAPSEHQVIGITCVATRINTMRVVEIKQSTAILMIQGETALKLYL